jgi:hypothetical protein
MQPFSTILCRSLQKQVANFFHPCVDMTWSVKGFEGPSFLIVLSFYRQRVLMAFSESSGRHYLMSQL